MPNLFNVLEVDLPLERILPLRDRGVIGVEGALSMGGGGGGGGEVAFTSSQCLCEVGSPSSSELKSES
jgi:hypothetical protein